MIKEVIDKKWSIRRSRQDQRYTCYYSPNEKHKLCPHKNNCILNPIVAQTYHEIEHNKRQIKILKRMYDDQSEYYGFNPRENVKNRRIMELQNKKKYRKLKNMETQPGGYI